MCQTIRVLVRVGHLRTQKSPQKGMIIQLSSHVLLINMYVYISVHANVSKKCAIQKQCMQPACKFMHASMMHANYKQNECKLCAHACKQMLTCNLQPFAYMHLGQILTCTSKQKITCKIRVLACMQHVIIFVRVFIMNIPL